MREAHLIDPSFSHKNTVVAPENPHSPPRPSHPGHRQFDRLTMKSLLRLVLLLFFTTSLGFSATPAEDLPLVTTRLAASFAATADGASELPAETLLATLDADGHWPDLDEKYPPDTQGAVSRYVHFLRVWKLAAVWRA